MKVKKALLDNARKEKDSLKSALALATRSKDKANDRTAQLAEESDALMQLLKIKNGRMARVVAENAADRGARLAGSTAQHLIRTKSFLKTTTRLAVHAGNEELRVRTLQKVKK